ncbi:MAG: ABC transporter permease [Promethearchaeota archaeon]
MKNKIFGRTPRIKTIIKDNLFQIFAITEKNMKAALRFKFSLIFSYFYPIIGLVLPMIILNQFFEYNIHFSPWTAQNYLVFIFLAYDISLLSRIYTVFSNEFKTEKYWRTLQALIIAPFNRFNLLFGIFLASLIQVCIPFSIFLIICYLYYHISIITLGLILLIFFLIALVFSGIGLFLGVLAISKENYLPIAIFLMTLVIWTSCVTYPYQIFPNIIQQVINLNPFYYIFDVLRLAWIQDNIILTFSTYGSNLLILFASSIITPLLGVYLFNIIYKKYGIVGY